MERIKEIPKYDEAVAILRQELPYGSFGKYKSAFVFADDDCCCQIRVKFTPRGYFSVYKVEFIPLGDSETSDIEHLGIRKDFVKAVQLGLKSLLVSEAL